MSRPLVYIDGKEGTTGLQIFDRLACREDIELLLIDEDKRKDLDERKKLMNTADLVFLCLPDAAAVEAVGLVENPDTRIIDASTAHRTAPGWVYGFPELGGEVREAVRTAKRVANPGCHATGFISIVYPLVKMGVLPREAALSCFSLTGYSGGGKKMIAQYEAADREAVLDAPALYALEQGHKHLPEMQKICGLEKPPVFVPIVDDYYNGMAVTVPLHMEELRGTAGLHSVWQVFRDFYDGQKMVQVIPGPAHGGTVSKIQAAEKRNDNDLRLILAGNDGGFTVTALFDNLGKGASGAAVQNMNIMLGFAEETGLEK